jgi:hypothetical protein
MRLAEDSRSRMSCDLWRWTNEPSQVEDTSGHFATTLAALAKDESQPCERVRFFEELLGKEAVEAGEKIGVQHAAEFRAPDLSETAPTADASVTGR